MSVYLNLIVAIIALQHLGFMILEMFFWTTPLGRKIFSLETDFAVQSAPLAANQGLYNGFLAAGLVWSLLGSNFEFTYSLKAFFLGCVLIAGIYGAYTVSKRILFIQALPAALALLLLAIS